MRHDDHQDELPVSHVSRQIIYTQINTSQLACFAIALEFRDIFLSCVCEWKHEKATEERCRIYRAATAGVIDVFHSAIKIAAIYYGMPDENVFLRYLNPL